jgi:hypothetical protein
MTEEENKNQEKTTISEKALNSFKKLWTVYILGGAAIITVVTKYQTFFDWIRSLDIFHLPFWVLMAFGSLSVIGIIVAIFYMKKATPAPNFAVTFFIISALFGGLIVMQRPIIYNNIIVVYDKMTEPYHPNTFENVTSQTIDNIPVLLDVGDINKGTVVISTVARPELVWSKISPKNSKFSFPILSLQEVIETSTIPFIDISFSDFDNGIKNIIQDEKLADREVRIFFEYGYEQAEKVLSKTLNKTDLNLITTSVVFNANSFKSVLSPNTLAIFLGSAEGLTTFTKNSNTTDYKHLVVPNWLRPTLPSSKSVLATNRSCMVSAVFDNLISTDLESWEQIFSTIRGDWKSDKELKANILSSFTSSDHLQLKEINF